MAGYALSDLEYWDARVREHVEVLGLDCFPQEFELCDHNQMLGYMAYSGMPAHYPHWSYGKAYEKPWRTSLVFIRGAFMIVQ